MSSAEAAILVRQATNLMQRDRLQEAEPLIARLKELQPLARETRGLQLEALIRAGRYEEAQPLAEQLCAAFPDSSRIHFLAGQLAYWQKRYAVAAEAFRESSRLHPRWRARHWLGKTLTQMGKYEEARAILEALVVKHLIVHRDLAWLYERMDRLEDAVASHERILALNPNSTASKKQITRLKARMMDPDTLLEEMETLRQLGETVPEHLVPEYAKSLFKRGQAKEARAFIERHMAGFDNRLAVKVGWECRWAQAFDLGFELMLRGFEMDHHNPKYINALELCARYSDRQSKLIDFYKERAPRLPNLYGRIKRLGR